MTLALLNERRLEVMSQEKRQKVWEPLPEPGTVPPSQVCREVCQTETLDTQHVGTPAIPSHTFSPKNLETIECHRSSSGVSQTGKVEPKDC